MSRELSGSGHPCTRKGMHPTPRAETPYPPCVTLHLAVHLCLFIIAFTKLVNVGASLNPVTCWSKLFKPMEGVIGPLIYNGLTRSTGGHLKWWPGALSWGMNSELGWIPGHPDGIIENAWCQESPLNTFGNEFCFVWAERGHTGGKKTNSRRKRNVGSLYDGIARPLDVKLYN